MDQFLRWKILDVLGIFFETKFRDLISNCTRICPNINELNKYYNATRFKNNYIDSCDVCYKYYKN